MATFNDKTFVDQIIAGDGWSTLPTHIGFDPKNPKTWYGDDFPVVKVVEYTNAWGNRVWGCVFYGNDLNQYRESEYVRDPKTIWERR